MDPFCCTTYHGVLASMLTPLCAEPKVLKPAQNIDHGLLSADDPTPVEWVNKNSQSPVMLLCEHAGNTLPGSKNQLGLQPKQLTEHIAWDLGAAAVARKVAAALDAPLLLQCYSRLLIDCNRPPESDESIPKYSDSIAIPGNQNLTSQDRQLDIDNAVVAGTSLNPVGTSGTAPADAAHGFVTLYADNTGTFDDCTVVEQ